MLLVTVGVFQINRPQDNPVSHVAAGNSSAASSDEDAQLLLAVAQRSPALKQIYESNLKSVNAYISDARSSVEKDPEDSQAREHLREAYAQKAMLYDMATSRSLE